MYSENTHLVCVYVCVNSCWKCHGELACRGPSAIEMSCYMGGKSCDTSSTRNHTSTPTFTYYMHTLLNGYMIMPRTATDTFITPVVIRNKPHYTQSLWFMINIRKGCGGSSSPSNPLISLNKKNREGEEDGGPLRGNVCICVWMGGGDVGAVGAFQCVKWNEGEVK